MAKEAKTPAIRFKGFTDTWEQYKVAEIATDVERSIDMKDDEVYQLVTVKRRNEGVVSRSFLKGKDILVKNYFEIRAGDYIISKRQVIHGANGFVPESLDKSVVSNEYLVIVSNDMISTKFWTLISQWYKMYKMFFLSSYGVDVEKMVFNVDDWKKRSINIPSVAEQNRIVEFFDNIDNLITLHKRKLEKLQNVKKAMLEKMFPKNGSNVPEIRFAGFTDTWEQRELEKITIKIGSGKTPKGGENSYVSEGIPLIRSQNVYDDIVDLNNVAHITMNTNKEMENSRVFENDILLNITGASIGRSAVYCLSSYANVNQHVCIIRPTKYYNSDFIQLNLTSPKGQQQINNSQAGGGREGLNFQQIGKIAFAFPSVEEQIKIGNYLKLLNNLIILHQRKLEKLKNIKKACLEKMFV